MIAFQSKASHQRTLYTNILFCSWELDLDLMTLIYEGDLDIPKMYLHMKNEHCQGHLRVPIESPYATSY